MIIKFYELSKLKAESINFFLMYGKNEGLQNDIIEKHFIKDFNGQIDKYDEIDFITQSDNIIEGFLNKSLFATKKIVIISRVTDKILKIIENIIEKNLIDTQIILKSGLLEKKSKLRNLFEKNKKLITIPFYEDDTKNLSIVVLEFLNKHKIKLSRECINLIISRANGDRENIKNEMNKILNYSYSNNKIEIEIVDKLTNLVENFSVNNLADNYLAKNKKIVMKILNENIYSNEDCVLVIRTILNKSKRLLNIIEKYNENKNLDKIIANTKPPIFWKDKENVKKQALSWTSKNLKEIIFEISKVELLIKKNSVNSLNILSNFILNN